MRMNYLMTQILVVGLLLSSDTVLAQNQASGCSLVPSVALTYLDNRLYREDAIENYEPVSQCGRGFASCVPVTAMAALLGSSGTTRIDISPGIGREECYRWALSLAERLPFSIHLTAWQLINEGVWPFAPNARAYSYVTWSFMGQDGVLQSGFVNVHTRRFHPQVETGDLRRRDDGSPLLRFED